MSAEEIFEKLKKSVIGGKRKDVAALCTEGKGAGIAGKDLLTKGLLPGMEEVGRRFRCEEFYIPEVLVAARAMHAGLEILRDELEKQPAAQVGKVVIGTVEGDLHDIGKNLVAMMLEGGGYKVIDLGVNVTADKFVEAVRDNPGCSVGLSALLTTTMVNMEKIIKAVHGVSPSTPILVGGAPVTDDFARRIRATAYAPDPQGALDYLSAAAT